MNAIQFSKDGKTWLTLVKIDSKELAETIMRAAAGYGAAFGHSYWRVRRAVEGSTDFHAVITDD